MKCRISKNGNLILKRSGDLKSMLCPYRNTKDIIRNCGDSCPLFIEDHDDILGKIVKLCNNAIMQIEEDLR